MVKFGVNFSRGVKNRGCLFPKMVLFEGPRPSKTSNFTEIDQFETLKFHQNYWWGGGAPIKNPCKSLARRSISTYRRAVKNRGWLFPILPHKPVEPSRNPYFWPIFHVFLPIFEVSDWYFGPLTTWFSQNDPKYLIFRSFYRSSSAIPILQPLKIPCRNFIFS